MRPVTLLTLKQSHLLSWLAAHLDRLTLELFQACRIWGHSHLTAAWPLLSTCPKPIPLTSLFSALFMVMNLLIQRCTIHSCTHAPMHPSFTHSQLCNRHDLQENRDLAGLFSPEGYIQLKWLPAKSSPATEALERMGVSACLEDTDGPCFCLGSWVLKLPFQ